MPEETPKMTVQSSDHSIVYHVRYKDTTFKREYHSDTGVTIWWQANYSPSSRTFADFQHGWRLVHSGDFGLLEQAFRVWQKNNEKDSEEG